MDTIKIARRLAELGQTADAQRAYTLALQAAGLSPEEELNRFEAARRGAIPASCLFTAGAFFKRNCWS